MDTTREVDRILADAAKQAGLEDFGQSWFLGPLSAYAADLEQPSLTEFGRRFLASRAVLDLVRRLRVLETLRQHPEIAAVSIPPIVYITGASPPRKARQAQPSVDHDPLSSPTRWTQGILQLSYAATAGDQIRGQRPLRRPGGSLAGSSGQRCFG